MAKQTKKAEKKEVDSQRARLHKELLDMLPEVEEQGLVFLIKQANTIIHNQRTVRLNREIEELDKKGKGRSVVQEEALADGFGMEIERSASGKNYHFIVNGTKHFFDIPETQKIVTLCYKPETKSSALKFLYQYFLNERDDVLLEHDIKSEKSPFFEELFRAVRANFTLD